MGQAIQPIPIEVLESLETLPIVLPDFGMASPPFSRGKQPDEYTPEGLKKIEVTSTARTDLFRKYVLAIEALTEAPVPYVFKTANGEIRSLDAGCLGFCINRTEPYFVPILNERGFIEAIESTPACDGQRPLIPSLVEEIRAT